MDKKMRFLPSVALLLFTAFSLPVSAADAPVGNFVQASKATADDFRADHRKVVKIANVRANPVYTHVATDAAWEWVNFRATPKDASQRPFTFTMLFVFAKKDGKWVSGGDAYAVGEFPATY